MQAQQVLSGQLLIPVPILSGLLPGQVLIIPELLQILPGQVLIIPEPLQILPGQLMDPEPLLTGQLLKMQLFMQQEQPAVLL